MVLQKAVTTRIFNLLKQHNLTRYALCKKIAMPEPTLQNIFDERTKDIKLKTIANIADGFGLSLSEFFDDSLFDQSQLEID